MKKPKYIIGVDEAGRGPIAGGVCVGLVMMENNLALKKSFNLKKDSKQLTKLGREEWFEKITDSHKKGDIFYSCAFSSNKIIDQKGIVFAVNLAIQRLFKNLEVQPQDCEVLLDGLLRAPEGFKNQQTIVRGDETVPIIGLASIVAKVSRDKKMTKLAQKHSEYGWQTNMGYGTPGHYLAIKKYGLTDHHRKSYLLKLT